MPSKHRVYWKGQWRWVTANWLLKGLGNVTWNRKAKEYVFQVKPRSVNFLLSQSDSLLLSSMLKEANHAER